MQILSDFTFDPMCSSPLAVTSLKTIVNPAGLGCNPCLVPVVPLLITIGRVAFVRTNGAGGNQSIGFTGGAAANGTQILFISASGSFSTDGIPSGGSAWTAFQSDQAPSARTFYKLCGASEPTSYTLSYSGSGKGDALQAIMIEILNANAMNPTASAYYREQDHGGTFTTSNQSVSSANPLNAIVVASAFAADATTGADNVALAPSGYTLQKYYAADILNGLWGIAIATKTSVGAGTISPGPFTDHGSGASYLMALATTTLWTP